MLGFFNNGVGLGDEYTNTFSATINIDPNNGSLQIIPNINSAFTVNISVDTDVSMLYLHVENTDVTNRLLTWGTGVQAFDNDTIAAGTHQGFLLIKLQSEWKKHLLGQTE